MVVTTRHHQPQHNYLFTYLEIADIRVGEERVFLVGIKEREVFHDDSDEQIQHDVGYDDVEAAVVHNGRHEAAAVSRPEGGMWRAGAVWGREHTVVQYPVPILSSHNSKAC